MIYKKKTGKKHFLSPAIGIMFQSKYFINYYRVLLSRMMTRLGNKCHESGATHNMIESVLWPLLGYCSGSLIIKWMVLKCVSLLIVSPSNAFHSMASLSLSLSHTTIAPLQCNVIMKAASLPS